MNSNFGNNDRKTTNVGSPFPKSVFPEEVFPRRIFPWMGNDEDQENVDQQHNDKTEQRDKDEV